MTTYRSSGILADWGERDKFIDSKHPHHMFLLQHFDQRLLMDSAVAMANLNFKAAAEKVNKSDHWKNLYYTIPEAGRRVGMSCMGWGDSTDVGPRGRKRKKGNRKTNK